MDAWSRKLTFGELGELSARFAAGREMMTADAADLFRNAPADAETRDPRIW